jgi:uncharacterized protein (TIGR03435 family)
MPADADPSFEVATIKPSNPDDHNSGFHINGHRFEIEDQTMDILLMFAYGVHHKQIVDAPAWFAGDHFDVDGILDAKGQPNLKQLQRVVQKILADRFALKFHKETRELSVYALRVAPGGPKFAKSQSDPDTLGDESNHIQAGEDTMSIANLSMNEFALSMQFYTDRPVVDQTGLAGKWDFKWTWTVDDTRVSPNTDAAPGMFAAMQEQLGLKLEAKKAPADVFVVDHVERPAPN